MNPKETVQALYAAYASGDPDRIRALLDPEVVWVAPAGNATQVALGLGSPDDAGPPRGLNDLDRDAIVAFMAHDYPRFFADVTFEPRTMVSEGDVVLTEHRMSATLPNGRPYVNDYCFAYEVADGRVTAIREYMDTRGGWLQAFATGTPEVLLEGTRPDS
ncbi:MAG TPA: nuclear transport factor 2 family protein [Solirubrobacteraceae bacterium]|nr:nuclear transport factor 2 family protein [Solirubrobacteraceae bacterium]